MAGAASPLGGPERPGAAVSVTGASITSTELSVPDASTASVRPSSAPASVWTTTSPGAPSFVGACPEWNSQNIEFSVGVGSFSWSAALDDCSLGGRAGMNVGTALMIHTMPLALSSGTEPALISGKWVAYRPAPAIRCYRFAFGLLSLTPGPPSSDFAPSSIDSTPAASRARRYLFSVESLESEMPLAKFAPAVAACCSRASASSLLAWESSFVSSRILCSGDVLSSLGETVMTTRLQRAPKD